VKAKPILLLGEAYGTNEARIRCGFVGASGVELLRMLDEVGIISLSAEDLAFISKFWNTGDPLCIDAIWRLHPEVARANVFNFHPPGNDLGALCGPKNEAVTGYPALVKSKYLHRRYIPELERLADEIAAVDPNLIVCLGNTPLWALAGTTGISKVRGTTRLSTHTATGYKLLPTYHPAAVLRQWELRPTTLADLTKAKREAEFPEVRRPECEIWIEPTLEDLDEFERLYFTAGSILAVDIETTGNRITCIGFSASNGVALVVPFDDTRRKGRSYWNTTKDEVAAWGFVRSVLGNKSYRKVFQNGLYDISFLYRSMGIKVLGAEHDTMLLHHALQPESLKGLGFLGSVYTDFGSWKQERRTTTIKKDE
jgi:uracil-DNA glycosylase